jgi:hypothetical protein
MADTTVRVHGSRTNTGIYENYTGNYSNDPEMSVDINYTAVRDTTDPKTVNITISGSNLKRENGYYGYNIWVFASSTDTTAKISELTTAANKLLISRDVGNPQNDEYWSSIPNGKGTKTIKVKVNSYERATGYFYIKTAGACSNCSTDHDDQVVPIGDNNFGIEDGRYSGKARPVAKVAFTVPDITMNAGQIISIKDNGDNTVTVVARPGSSKNAELNPVDLSLLEYAFKVDDKWPAKNSEGNDTNSSLTFEASGSTGYTERVKNKDDNKYDYYFVIPIPTNATNFRVRTRTKGKFGASAFSKAQYDTKEVDYYAAPSAPTNLYYSSKGITNNPKSRIKNDLTWVWNGASPFNSFDCNKIKGYRVYLFKVLTEDGTPVTGSTGNSVANLVDLKASYGDIQAITSNRGTSGYEIATARSESDNVDISFNPKKSGFAGKNVCYCRVYAYSTNGVGTKLFSSYIEGFCVLYNSAIVWVKTGKSATDWTEGIPYIRLEKTDGTIEWREADSVLVKTSDNSGTTDQSEWTEST